jgi:hypothetical protein
MSDQTHDSYESAMRPPSANYLHVHDQNQIPSPWQKVEGYIPGPDADLITDEALKVTSGQLLGPNYQCGESLTRAKTDWEKQLLPEEVKERKDGDGKVVLLKGLQRLARIAGLVYSMPALSHVVGPQGNGLIQCVYTARFSDGAVYGGAADVNVNNSKEPYLNYPTSLAESRAEARALRKALGIAILAAEEIDFTEGYVGSTSKPTDKADGQQVSAIQSLLDELSLKPIDLINEVANGREVYDLNDLTSAEAVSAMRWLNGQRSTSAPKRAARKEVLKNKLGE